MAKITIDTVVAATDELEPNQYSLETKLDWLSTLDGKIYEEVIKTHKEPPVTEPFLWPSDPLNTGGNKPTETEPEEDELKPYTSASDTLLVGTPYGKDLYCFYLQAMIAMQNSEITKYNQKITLFNTALDGYQSYYNRLHMATQPKGGNRMHF